VGDITLSPSGVLHWADGGFSRFIERFGIDSEITLNILLFVPAGILLSLKYRRPWLAVSLLGVLSLLIELAQGLFGLGNPDASDLVSNLLGALLGAQVASIALCFTRFRNPTILGTAVGVTFAITACIAAANPLAGLRERGVEHQLLDRFSGTTLANYRRWDETNVLNSTAFQVDRLSSDGSTISADQATVRFPVNTFGIRRCVLAIWTAPGFHVQRESGTPCAEFLEK
jgi:hypothetical protein